jgi:hypothetical protein
VREALRPLPEVEAKKKEADRKKRGCRPLIRNARVMKMPDGGFRPTLTAPLSALAINKKVCRRKIGRVFIASCLS